MGLGKTLQVASFLALRLAIGEERPALIVVPTVLLETWQEELDRFFIEDTFAPIVVLHGPGLRRFRADGHALDVDTLARARLVITNYETLAAHQLSLLKIDFSTAVFDEAQALKNETTLRSRAAQGLKRRFAVALTGTPVENRLSDLWAIFEAIEQRADTRSFGSRSDFESEYEQRGAAGTAAVRARLRFPSPTSSVLRREKSEALRDLPPKDFHEVRIPMTRFQYELERVIARELRVLGPFSTLDRLRKLYQHPRLLDQGPRVRLGAAQAIEESPKMMAALAILRDIASRGEKALVFTQWVQMQDLLVQLFTAKLGLRQVGIINGAPENRSAAQKIIARFSATPGFDVLVLSPLAAGIGLTITAANHVLHYGRWWNPAKEDQATDRAYRIGQTLPVHVYHLLLHHPGSPDRGFDIRLHELVERKRRVARDFLAPIDVEGEPAAELDTLVAEELAHGQ
jgi:SNF2 family DNA or RNA helicase